MSDDLVKQLRAKNASCAPNFSTPIADPVKLKAADRIEELEAKLAKAVEALTSIKARATMHRDDDDKERQRQLMHIHARARKDLAELTGGKDE